MAGRLSALMARQQDCQRSLGRLAEEQEAFLREVRSFADAGQLWDSGASVRWEAPHASKQPANEPPAERPARNNTSNTLGSFEDEPEPMGAVHFAPNSLGSASLGASHTFPLSTSHISLNGSGSRNVRNHRVTMSTVHLKNRLDSLFQKTASNSFLQETMGCVARARASCEGLLSRKIFETAMGLIIIVNAANIGWMIERELKHQDTSVQTIIEIVILGIFWAELAMHFFVRGLASLRISWNLFDFAINLVTTLVLVTVSVSDEEEDSGRTFAETMKQMMVLRMIRLLRLFRAVRLIQMSKSLWKLVQGLKQCLRTMIDAMLLILISLFVFACIGAETITKTYTGDPVIGGIVEKNMSSIPRIMLTLFQFIMMDNTATIYIDLVHRNGWLMVYFLLLVTLVTIMLMNLITAVIVEDAITSATMDQDVKTQFLRKKLRTLRPAFVELFQLFDTSGNSAVRYQDIVSAVNSGLHIPEQIEDLVTPARMLDLFDLLDQDNSGELTQAEFVDGMSCLALSDVPLETMQILHILRSLRREMRGMGYLGPSEDGRCSFRKVAPNKAADYEVLDDGAKQGTSSSWVE